MTDPKSKVRLAYVHETNYGRLPEKPEGLQIHPTRERPGSIQTPTHWEFNVPCMSYDCAKMGWCPGRVRGKCSVKINKLAGIQCDTCCKTYTFEREPRDVE